MIPLCVPKGHAGRLKALGAFWNHEIGGLVVDAVSPAFQEIEVLRDYLPYRYRPDRHPPYVRPWMVPQPLWGWNLRALLVRNNWDVVRRWAYERSGHRCRICGLQGEKHPVEADEGWAYDDNRKVQTLKGVIGLCPRCHEVRHWGRTMAIGREEQGLQWMMTINGWSRSEAQSCAQLALKQWQERSRWKWTCDVSWVERQFGFTISAEGPANAGSAQKTLEQLARRTYSRS